ncbi:MAG: hypothetical protein AAFU57_01560 [Bacteroidota bacterium]
MKKIVIGVLTILLLLFTLFYLIPSLIGYIDETKIRPEVAWYKVVYTLLQIAIAIYFMVRGIKHIKTNNK